MSVLYFVYLEGDVDTASATTPHSTRTSPRPRQVHTITDRFSLNSTYVVDDGHLVVVDPGSDLHVRQLETYLHRFLYRRTQDIDLIVLTHLHPEHTAGLASLLRLCHAPVAASSAALRIAQFNAGERHFEPDITHLARSVFPAYFSPVMLTNSSYTQQVHLVDTWLEDKEGLPGHADWRVLASPGHSPESLCLYNPFTTELLSGDTIVIAEERTPLLRSSSSASRRVLEMTLHVLRTLDIRYLYPGHGRALLGKNLLQHALVR